MNEQRINLLPFLAEAFSTNERVYSLIDKYYNQNPNYYDNLFNNSDLIKSQLAHQGTLQQDYYFAKVGGLLLSNPDEISQETVDKTIEINIDEFIKKGFGYSWTYIEQHNQFTCSEFLPALIKKKKGIDKISDTDFNSYILMAVTASQIMEKPIIQEDIAFKKYIQTLNNRILKLNLTKDLIKTPVSSKERRDINKCKNLIKQRGKIDLKDPLYSNVFINPSDDIFMDIKSIPDDCKYYVLMEKVFDSTVTGLDLDIISICNSSQAAVSRAIDRLVIEYLKIHCIDADTIEEEQVNDLEMFLYIANVVIKLLFAYDQAKNYTLNDININKNQELNKVQLNLESMINKNKEYQAEIDILTQENKRLQNCLDETENNNKELYELREFIYSLSEKGEVEETIPDTLSYDDLCDLNKYKGVIVGGHTSWQQRLREKLPSWTFISTNNYHFDGDILKNSQVIFINTTHIGHALYKKVISLSGRTPVKYLNNNNIDITLNTINNLIINCRQSI